MQNRLSQIEELEKKLLDMGYHSYQINTIIEDVIGTTNYKEIDYAKADLLVKELKNYVSFAIKCKSLAKR